MGLGNVTTKHELPWFLVLVLFVILRVVSDQLERTKQQFEKKELQQQPDNDRNPIIILSEESGKYLFSSGSAELSEKFQTELRQEIVPRLDSLASRYRCNVVEVIGHTDGQPIGYRMKRKMNLDADLRGFIVRGDRNLTPGSNADLALMRAGAVVRFFINEQSRGHLAMIRHFYPYSAAQAILPNGEIDGSTTKRPNASRRRIELRLIRID